MNTSSEILTQRSVETLSTLEISPAKKNKGPVLVPWDHDLNHFLTTTAPKVLFVTSQVYTTIKKLLPNHCSVKFIIVYDSDTHSDTVSFDDILSQHVETTAFLPTKVDPETRLSYIVFSSGTTGLPKGVIHTQRGHPQNGTMNADHTVVIILPMFHIFGLIMTIGAIVNNAKVLLLEKFKPDVFLNIIQKYRATYLPVVPTLLQFLSKSKIVEEYDLSSLRDIFCGGAPVGEETEQLIARRFNNLVPRQIFGTTEAGGGAIIMPPGHKKPGSVGKVVIGNEVKIVALGPNKIGEICVRGPSVMKGYYKNEVATKKDLDQHGFLHSGDLGYYDEEMYFYVLDRIKEVIKYKGFQVSPAQLENILFQHPGLVAQHLHSEKQLHGGVIFVEEIPKTQSGKIARAELRKSEIISYVFRTIYISWPITCERFNNKERGSCILQCAGKKSERCLFASRLRRFGLKKNDMIGVVSPSSWKYSVCILASSYLGVTVAGTNPNYLKDDLTHFLSKTHPKVIFVTTCVYQRLEGILHEHPYVRRVIIMDSELNEQNVFSFNSFINGDEGMQSIEIAEADDDDAVFILFSSGTTGFPKAVPFSQKALKTTIQIANDPRYVAVTNDTTVLVIPPLFHIFGLVFLVSTIVANGKVVLMEAFKPDLFLQSIEKYKVTYLPLVPSLMVFLVKSPKVDEYDISSLNDAFCGGSPIGVDLEKLFYKRVNNVRPRQGYGLTEAGIVSMMFPKLYKPGSVGKLTPTIEMKVINPDTKTVLGANQSGEICVRGPTIMKSYLNDEEASRQDIDSDRFLHTGDMGYITEDGYLYIVDRIKEVIKYKGFQHPGVKEAAVVGKPDERAGELPTAFIVKQENMSVTAQELVDLIAEHFHADKQLHGGVIFVEEIPKTATGKISRKVLKELVQQY
nr:unnamed protein product [Callosobruchus chinensis]